MVMVAPSSGQPSHGLAIDHTFPSSPAYLKMLYSYFLKKCSLNLKNFSKFYSGRYGVLFFFVKTKPSTDNSGQERICFGEKKHALGREMF